MGQRSAFHRGAADDHRRAHRAGREGFVRKPSKKVDYLLRYPRDFALAVVEAKVLYKTAEQAVQQARQYAENRYASDGS